jgi:DNA-directed RNA polymerase subunit RPC12/RpoP
VSGSENASFNAQYLGRMGFRQTFRCEACDFEALVSGGPDAVMNGYTRTMACAACMALYDVLVDGFTPERELHCPECGSQQLQYWDHPAPCPQCGGAMAADPDGPALCAD